MAANVVGQNVTRICFDYALTILTSGGSELRIETPFLLTQPDGIAVLIQPDDPGLETVRVLSLLQQAAERFTIEESGALRASFSNGAELSVDPHESFEAWSLVDADGRRVVCMPGGGTSSWEPKG